jgi:membrane protease YdiL (CAAX protease family)
MMFPGMGGPVKAMGTRQQTSFRAFINRHAVLTYFTLVFGLSWGLPLIIIAGPGAVLGSGAKLTSPAGLPTLMYLVTLAYPPSVALAGILVIALAYGMGGLRDLRSRVFRWRVGVRWYAAALLTAPLLETAILGALSLTSKAFLPAIITADDMAGLLVAGLVLGLYAAFFEEIGWTGFATHELSKRHGLLATGLILGLPWCMLHVPFYAQFASGAVPSALYVAAIIFWMLPYRVLMVWVYDRTQNVLMAMLMHLMLTFWPFVSGSPARAGVPDLIFLLVLGATAWVFVAAVVMANRRKLWREEHTPVTPLAHVE